MPDEHIPRQDGNTQAIQAKRKPMGKARVKPRHLSPVLWESIICQFRIRQSSEDVAEELGLPVRTVSDVIDLHRMGALPAGAIKPFLMRRTA